MAAKKGRKRAKRETVVHSVMMMNPLGDIFLVVPTSPTSWVSEAIKTLPEWAHKWSDALGVWFVDMAAEELFETAIEEAIGHDEPWCKSCEAFMESADKDVCKRFDEIDEEEHGYTIVHPSAIEEKQAEVEASDGFKIPDALLKLFAADTETGKFARGAARNLAKQYIPLPEALINEFMDAVFASMGGVGAAAAESGMTREQAAEILGLKWPCSKEEVLTAFRKKAFQCHPDAPGGSHEAMVKVGLAREVLMKALG